MTADRPAVALVHDYLTQRGGAERVVLAMTRAFPGAPIHTSLHWPPGTFPEFTALDVRPGPLQRIGPLRRHHRLGLPLYPVVFGRTEIDAEVTLCSSSGWAHGVRTTGTKIVYCHAPARWLYQTERYLGTSGPGQIAAATLLRLLRPYLERWDGRAAKSADRYLANSTATANLVRDLYGIAAEVLPPPPALLPDGPLRPIAGLEPGFFLTVARLLPYKNLDATIAAFRELRGHRLVIVGEGPERPRLERDLPVSVQLLGRIDDAQLRWCFAAAAGLVAASYEDYGLTPLEAAAFGRPTAALRAGGYLDTVVEGVTGVFFARPEPRLIAEAVRQLATLGTTAAALQSHAARFTETSFTARLRAIVTAAAGSCVPAEGEPAPRTTTPVSFDRPN